MNYTRWFMKQGSLLHPDMYVGKAGLIDFQALRRNGIRLILIDIDNTLIDHGGRAFEIGRA